SASPSSRRATNRLRQVPTVAAQTPSARATAVLLVPSAQARTIRARRASRWVLLGRLAQRGSVCRSSSDSTRSGLGPGIPHPFLGGSSGPAVSDQHTRLCNGLLTQDTSVSCVQGRPSGSSQQSWNQYCTTVTLNRLLAIVSSLVRVEDRTGQV